MINTDSTNDALVKTPTTDYVPKIKKIMVLVGPSGCGKTTFAKGYISKNPGWVRVNRDDIRKTMLGELNFGEYFTKDNAQMERHVTSLQMDQIRYWNQQGMNVIIDNTHLKKTYLINYLRMFGHMAEIIFVPIKNTTAEVCKERVRNREGNNVNVDYIDNHFRNFENLLEYAGDMMDKYYEQKNPDKAWFKSIAATKDNEQECIIVDVDGTVADCTGIRSAYDGSKLHLDRPIEPVKRLLEKMAFTKTKKSFFGDITNTEEPVTIIYLSGREEKYKVDTVKWLTDNGFPYHGRIFMRPTGDMRPDHEIKQELLMNNIASDYKILFAIDDRLQVCHNVWYKLGIFCLNVNQGLKSF